MDIHEAPKESQHHVVHSEPKATISIKKNQLFVGMAIALLVIGFAGGYFIHDITGAGGGTVNPTSIIDANDPVLGKANAPLTIIEFSDPSCPFCAAAEGQNQQVIQYLLSKDPTWVAPVPNIVKDYVDTGKVKLVFKYFPGHGTGAEAMEIALCANEQDKFWEVSNMFFANQGSMGNVSQLEAIASTVPGIDAQKLTACYDSKKYDAALQADMQAGQTAGVSGTPAFFIGTDKDGYTMIVGAQSYTAFKQIIDAALA
jgi:protein-disulfide isomerase